MAKGWWKEAAMSITNPWGLASSLYINPTSVQRNIGEMRHARICKPWYRPVRVVGYQVIYQQALMNAS
jgi:hypothetical protein